MFSQACVILFTWGGGCLPQCMLGCHPPRSRHPPGTRYTPCEQTPPRDQVPPDQVHTPPGTRYTPPYQVHPPKADTPPRAEHDGRYGQRGGRSASYWNAILYSNIFRFKFDEKHKQLIRTIPISQWMYNKEQCIHQYKNNSLFHSIHSACEFHFDNKFT